MSAAVTTNKRKPFYQSVTIDVDIDATVLEDAGYHHEDDCPGGSYDDMDVPDHVTNRRALIDWHDLAHGLTLWANCTHEPCHLLTDDFRRTA